MGRTLLLRATSRQARGTARYARVRLAARGRLSVGTGEHHGVTIEIADPHLAMQWAAVALGRVAMWRHHDRCSELVDPRDRRVEVIDLEPEQHAVAVGAICGIADMAMVVVDLEV